MCPCKTHAKPKHKTKRAMKDHVHALKTVSVSMFTFRVAPNITLDLKHPFGDQGGAK
jgi:hypothetical protein